MSTRTRGRLGAIVTAFFLAYVMMAGGAQAASVTFTFDCTIVDASTCTPGGPFGTLKLTDSTVDPNRVDMDLTILPNAGVENIAHFFLNYNGAVSLTGKAFRMVSQSAAPDTFVTNGVDSVTPNNAGPLGTTLDITLVPNSTFVLSYSGSLVLRTNDPQHPEADISVDMFNLKDNNNLLYAAFNTNPIGTSLNGGARVSAPTNNNTGSVPEPGTLMLLGSGVAGAGVIVTLSWRRRQRSTERAS